MYLLNKQELERHTSNPNSSYLSIKNFNLKNLQHTSYYFRVGSFYKIVHSPEKQELKELTRKDNILTIHPNQYILVRSAEVFKLSNKVKAMVGSNGETVASGLLLNYSPFIDPLFEGDLEIGIKNLLTEPIHLKLGQKLGKLSFFDISDTYPIEMVAGSFQEKKFEERSKYEYDDGIKYPEVDDDSELYKRKNWKK